MRKIRTIMTKTRKEGIRCINREISLLSSHFLLFVFLPAAAFTCRSQTRSPGQSSAKQQTGWLNEPNRCPQLNFWTSLMLFSAISFEFDIPTTCLTGRTCSMLISGQFSQAGIVLKMQTDSEICTFITCILCVCVCVISHRMSVLCVLNPV